MNARIQELAAQAQKYAEYVTPQGCEWFDTFKEKFAELIVAKCCDMVNKHTQHNNPHDCLLVLDIKEHLGINNAKTHL